MFIDTGTRVRDVVERKGIQQQVRVFHLSVCHAPASYVFHANRKKSGRKYNKMPPVNNIDLVA